MATPAYMSITGEVQGLITAGAFTAASIGNSFQTEHKDEVMVQGFSHEVTKSRDPQSGQPVGHRIHQPLIITKAFDKASPLLQNALCSGELITEVIIKWYRTTSGAQEHYYTTTLEDAVVVHIKDYMHNCQDPANAHFSHLEDVHFSYRKIIWLHVASGTSGSDDWRSPIAG